MAFTGPPYDWGGSDFTFANTGVRAQVVHPTLVLMSTDLTALMDQLEPTASTTDGVVKHYLQETDGAIDYDNAIAFGADFNETDPQTQTKAHNLVQKIRRSATLSQESLRDKRLGPAQDQKMLQANQVMRHLTRDCNAAAWWSQQTAGSSNTAQKMDGVLPLIDNGGTGYGGAGNNTDGAAFSEDNVITNLLEKLLLTDASYPATDMFFPQNLIKHLGAWSGFYGTTNDEVVRTNASKSLGVGAISTYDGGYSENGGPVSVHYERGSYLDIDPTTFTAGANQEHAVALHMPMWELCNFEPGTLFWREPHVVGGYRWHCEAYRSFTILARAGSSGGASMTRMTGV